MVKCLICGIEFHNNKALGRHINVHNMSAREYKVKFGILKKCLTCGKVLGRNNKTGYCNNHRNRNGENNPFYNKHHSDKTKVQLQKSSREGTLRNWKDKEYREKVIKGEIGKTRSDKFKETQRKNTLKQFKDPNQRKLRSKK